MIRMIIYEDPISVSVDYIRHLSIRLDRQMFEGVVENITRVLEVCEPFKTLKTLRIHVIPDAGWPAWGSCFSKRHSSFRDGSCFYRSYQRHITNAVNHQSTTTTLGANSPSEISMTMPHSAIVGQLDEIVVDGLADDVMRFNAMVLRLASTAVNPRERIGLGIGKKGRSYYNVKGIPGVLEPLRRVPGGPELTWIRFENVDDWIVKHARRSYDTTTDRMSRDLKSYLPRGMSTTDPLLKGWSWT